MKRRSSQGISMVELLVAMAVFAVVMVIAYAAISGSLRIQAEQEAVTTTQGKLRRVVEVMTQDLRSAVFGSIIGTPYNPSNTQVSFMMLTGGAGHTVLQPASLNDFPFEHKFQVQMPDARHLQGTDVVMINSATGTGVVLPITTVASGPDSGIWELRSHCANTIRYDLNNMLVFEIATLGLTYDPETESIKTIEDDGREVPFAFGITDFRVEYVYVTSGQDPDVRTNPVLSANEVPVRTFEDGGNLYTLQRIQFVVSAEAESAGRAAEHSYTGQVDLSRTQHFTVEEIVPCD